MTNATAELINDIERELRALLHAVRRGSVENAQLIHPELQPAAYAVLLCVGDNEPIRASEIVDRIGVDKGAVSRQVAHLQEVDLVEGTCDPDDRRAQRLKLSVDGRARLARVAKRRREEFAHRLAAWSIEDLSLFAAKLNRYNNAMEPVPTNSR